MCVERLAAHTRVSASAPWRMNHLFINLCHAIKSNSLALLHCERMVCRFQFDGRADTIVPEMNHRLQIQGFRIKPDVRNSHPKNGPCWFLWDSLKRS